MIIGVDYHPGFRQIAFVVEERVIVALRNDLDAAPGRAACSARS
jgi:hypothetical protein